MKIYPALAALEFDDIPVAIRATDAMLKKAPIAFFKSGTITQGRYLTLIGGTTASVQESAEEGVRAGGSHVIDRVVLPDVHAGVYDAIFGGRKATGGSIAILETGTVSATIRGAEAALKGTPVTLLEIRVADHGLAGKALSVFEGTLHDIEAAIALAVNAANASSTHVSSRVIPAPHEALTRQLANGTWLGSAVFVDLEGESI